MDENAALSQEQPIPAAEAEHVAQPDSVADDRSGESGGGFIPPISPPPGIRPYLVTVTMPSFTIWTAGREMLANPSARQFTVAVTWRTPVRTALHSNQFTECALIDTFLLLKVIMSQSAHPMLSARHDQMFPTLAPEEIDRLHRFGEARSYAAGERIVKAGDVAPGLIVILAGKVEVTQDGALDQRETIVTHEPRQFVGRTGTAFGPPVARGRRGPRAG